MLFKHLMQRRLTNDWLELVLTKAVNLLQRKEKVKLKNAFLKIGLARVEKFKIEHILFLHQQKLDVSKHNMSSVLDNLKIGIRRLT